MLFFIVVCYDRMVTWLDKKHNITHGVEYIILIFNLVFSGFELAKRAFTSSAIYSPSTLSP